MATVPKTDHDRLIAEAIQKTKDDEAGKREAKVDKMLVALSELKLKGKENRIMVKQPEIFKLGGNFKIYKAIWENYSNICEIKDENKIKSLMCFLSDKCLARINTLQLTDAELKDYNNTITKIEDVIDTKYTALQTRLQLTKVKQELDESLTDYADRLMRWADIGYEELDRTIKTRNLIDAFVGGLRDDDIALKVLGNPKDTFKDTYQYTLEIDATYRARKPFSSKSIEARSILTIENGLEDEIEEN